MKTFLFLVFAGLACAQTPIQSVSCQGNTTTTTFPCSLPNVTAGSNLTFMNAGGGITISSVTITGGSGGCTPTNVLVNAIPGTAGRGVYVSTCANATATASTLTFTFTQSAVSSSITSICSIAEWPAANFPTTITTEGTAGTASWTTATNPFTASVTPTASDPVLLFGVLKSSGGFAGPASNSFNLLNTFSTGTEFVWRFVNSASGSYSTTFVNWSGTTGASGIGAIKGIASASSSPTMPPIIMEMARLLKPMFWRR